MLLPFLVSDASSAVSMNEQSVPVEKAAKMTEEELEGKIITGCLVNKPREDYYTKYKRIIDAQNVEG